MRCLAVLSGLRDLRPPVSARCLAERFPQLPVRPIRTAHIHSKLFATKLLDVGYLFYDHALYSAQIKPNDRALQAPAVGGYTQA